MKLIKNYILLVMVIISSIIMFLGCNNTSNEPLNVPSNIPVEEESTKNISLSQAKSLITNALKTTNNSDNRNIFAKFAKVKYKHTIDYRQEYHNKIVNLINEHLYYIDYNKPELYLHFSDDVLSDSDSSGVSTSLMESYYSISDAKMYYCETYDSGKIYYKNKDILESEYLNELNEVSKTYCSLFTEESLDISYNDDVIKEEETDGYTLTLKTVEYHYRRIRMGMTLQEFEAFLKKEVDSNHMGAQAIPILKEQMAEVKVKFNKNNDIISVIASINVKFGKETGQTITEEFSMYDDEIVRPNWAQ